jgi:hypothetical protein
MTDSIRGASSCRRKLCEPCWRRSLAAAKVRRYCSPAWGLGRGVPLSLPKPRLLAHPHATAIVTRADLPARKPIARRCPGRRLRPCDASTQDFVSDKGQWLGLARHCFPMGYPCVRHILSPCKDRQAPLSLHLRGWVLTYLPDQSATAAAPATRCNDVARMGQFRTFRWVDNFVTTPRGLYEQARTADHPQNLTSDTVLELARVRKFDAKSGDKLEVGVKNWRWLLTAYRRAAADGRTGQDWNWSQP